MLLGVCVSDRMEPAPWSGPHINTRQHLAIMLFNAYTSVYIQGS
jgi:hypothetical protein